MLLRTASAPSLRSSPSSSLPQPDPISRVTGAHSVSLTLSTTLPGGKKILRSSSVEADLFKGLPLRPRRGLSTADPDGHFPVSPKEVVKLDAGVERAALLLTCSVRVMDELREGSRAGGGPGNAGRGGGASGRGGGGGGGGGREWGGGQESESLDEHYQSLIGSYPGDALLLGNYARFLKEVKGDADKAEEYCARAILAKRSNGPPDGDVLSLYGNLIWKKHRDGPRAHSYFDQAIRSSPDDCYVLASYARFLWDSGEEGDDNREEGNILKNKTCIISLATDDQNAAAAC